METCGVESGLYSCVLTAGHEGPHANTTMAGEITRLRAEVEKLNADRQRNFDAIEDLRSDRTDWLGNLGTLATALRSAAQDKARIGCGVVLALPAVLQVADVLEEVEKLRRVRDAAEELHAAWVRDYASLQTDALIGSLRAALDAAKDGGE